MVSRDPLRNGFALALALASYAALACGGGRREAGRGWGRRNKIKGCGGGEWGGGKKRERGEPDAERVTLRKGNLKKIQKGTPGGEGVPLRTKVSKSGGVFQFFGGRMTSRGQGPKGVRCL